MARGRDSVIAMCSRVDGWMSLDGLGWLYDQAEKLPARGKWVEVGIYSGRSFLCVLEALHPRAMLYGVDDFRGVRCFHSGLPLHQKFLDAMKLSRRRDFSLLPVASDVAAEKFLDASLDVVFIDASHNYDSVVKDVQSWRPKVKKGGMLCGHDVSDTAVKRAVTQCCPGYQKELGDIWSVRL